MAARTIFYAVAFSFIFFSCADSNNGEEKDKKSESTPPKISSSKIKSIKLSGNSNAAVKRGDSSSNSVGSSFTDNLITYQSGDLVPISDTIEDMQPENFVSVYNISGASKAIQYSDGEDKEVYIVLSNDIAVPLSEIGLPKSQSGNLKSSSLIYQRLGHYFFNTNSGLINLVLTNTGDSVAFVMTSDVKHFTVHSNFIHFRKNNGKHYIYKFFNNTYTRLDSTFTASISNRVAGYSNTDGFNAEDFDYVFKKDLNCIVAKIRNSGDEAPYDYLCVNESGGTKVYFSRPGLVDCYNESNIGQWCYSGGSNRFNIPYSLSNCLLSEVHEGYLLCESSIRFFYYDLNSFGKNQMEFVGSSISAHSIVNFFQDFDKENIFMISGNDGSLKLSKTNAKTRVETLINVSAYTKPNWITYCNGSLDISIDDKFLKLNPTTNVLTEIGSNAGIEEYECMD